MGIELHWKDETFHIKHFVNVFRMRFHFVIYTNGNGFTELIIIVM